LKSNRAIKNGNIAPVAIVTITAAATKMKSTTSYNTKKEHFIPLEYMCVLVYILVYTCLMGTGYFPGKKRLGRGADHPHPPSAEVQNDYTYTSTPLWALGGLL
jgi:hypothetical protein